MAKLTNTQITTLNNEVFDISYNISCHVSDIEAECLALRKIFLNDKGQPKLAYVVAKQLEDTIVFGRVSEYLKRVAKRTLSLDDVATLKNTKEKTEQEKAAFKAGRDHKSWLLNKAKIPTCENRGGNNNKSGKSGKPKGTVQNVKTVEFTAKTGTSLTPKVSERTAAVKYVRGMAATMYAFIQKNKDLKGCEDLIRLVDGFYRGATLIKE